VRQPCTFCRIVAGDEPAEIVHEDTSTLVFMDALPMTPGHCLVIPKAHRRDLLDTDPGDGDVILASARLVGGWMIERLGARGMNLITNCGAAADQSQFHVHFHLVPRYGGDRLLHPWERRFGDWSEIAKTAAMLRGE
jgi:histidine triad (HIT) family protein